MKTTVLVMAAILISDIAYASEGIRLSIKPAEAESATIEIRNETRDEVAIDVTDERGNRIFNKTIQEPAGFYQRKYDFSGLDNGSYVLRARSGQETSETHFDITGQTVTVTKERRVAEPYVKMTGDTWKISYLNYTLEDMNLYVYEGSRLLHHEKLEPDFAVHKGLDLSELVPGNYEIIFANEYNTFGYSVKVK